MNKVKLPHYGLYGLQGGEVSTDTKVTTNVNSMDANNPPGTMLSRWWDKLFNKEDNKTASGVISESAKKSSWLQNANEIVEIFRQIPGVENWFSANIGETILGWKCPNNTDTCEAQEIKNLEEFVLKTATTYRFTKASIQSLTDKQIIASLDRIIHDYNKREALLRSIATTYKNQNSLSVPARIKGADSTKASKFAVILFVNEFLATRNKHVEIKSNTSKSAKDWTGKSFTYQSPIFKIATGTVILDINGNAKINNDNVITANVGAIATTTLVSALAYTYYLTAKKKKDVRS